MIIYFDQYLTLIQHLGKQAKDKADSVPAKKTRKKRDPDAPKKPMSAFFWYQ
jgi:hypothetical protein